VPALFRDLGPEISEGMPDFRGKKPRTAERIGFQGYGAALPGLREGTEY